MASNTSDVNLSRRRFLTGLGGLGAMAALSQVFPNAAEARTNRPLITPEEFLDRLNQARTSSARDYYDVQRNYRIFPSGSLQLPVIINQGEVGEHTITAEFDPDLLFRESGATIQEIVPSNVQTSYVDVAPTVAFMGSLHSTLFNINPNDPSIPTPEDLTNFEWRTRNKAESDGIRTAVTWDERLKHIVTYHHVNGRDVNKALIQSRQAIRSLTPDGRRAALDVSNDRETDFAHLTEKLGPSFG